MYSISLGGRTEVLSRSRYEERLLRPSGADCFASDDGEDPATVGAAGGGGKGEVRCKSGEAILASAFCSAWIRAL